MQYQPNSPLLMLSHRTIVGVVRDFHIASLQHKVEPMVMMMPPAVNEQDNLYVKLAKGKTGNCAILILKNTMRTI